MTYVRLTTSFYDKWPVITITVISIPYHKMTIIQIELFIPFSWGSRKEKKVKLHELHSLTWHMVMEEILQEKFFLAR